MSSSVDEKDDEKILSGDAEDLACLKDTPEDHEDHPSSSAPLEDKMKQVGEDLKDKDEESNANDDFARAIDVLSAETPEAPPSPLSKKHERSDSPTPVVLPAETQPIQEAPSTASAAPAPLGDELHEPLAGGIVLIHDGPPLEPIPLTGAAWPEGWRQRIVLRKTGGRKGPRKDNYFYTPVKGYELIGFKKAKLFLSKLKECNGDEDKALESMNAPIV